MIRDLRTGLKLMRYAYGVKTNLTQAGVVLAMGLLYNLGEGGIGNGFGNMFFMSMAIIPVQLCYSLSVSDFVKTSPMRKRMQTSVPVLIHCFIAALIYLAEVLLFGLVCLGNPELERDMCRNILSLAVMAAAMMLYLGICYKFYLVSSVFLILFLSTWFLGGLSVGKYFLDFFSRSESSFRSAALLGLGIVALGGAAEYLGTLLVYRAPLSKMAQQASLRKAL